MELLGAHVVAARRKGNYLLLSRALGRIQTEDAPLGLLSRKSQDMPKDALSIPTCPLPKSHLSTHHLRGGNAAPWRGL